jgi:glycosyltransferase involved in cell wall biosynthesis
MSACLIIVENLPVPLDRRVWQEAKALTAAGWKVSVICPQSQLYPAAEETIDGIHVFRHAVLVEASGRLGFVAEYASALYHETRLAWKVYCRHGFDVVHACNPPDLIFLVALPFKLLGKKFVFDQHDICPELFTAKFGRRGPVYWGTRLCEWLTYRLADRVITANERFKVLCSRRNKKDPGDITPVQSIPDRHKFVLMESEQHSRADACLTLGYVGVIGDQDGVDTLVRAVAVLRDRGVTNFMCLIVGDGPSCKSAKALVKHFNLEDTIEFTGFLSGQILLNNLSRFDIGVIPDPRNSYTDNITMNKVFEYMFLGKPIVSFRLAETMALIGPCGLYAEEETPEALADAILVLMQDKSLRTTMGEVARRRAQTQFSWDVEAKKLVGLYEALLPQAQSRQARPPDVAPVKVSD